MKNKKKETLMTEKENKKQKLSYEKPKIIEQIPLETRTMGQDT